MKLILAICLLSLSSMANNFGLCDLKVEGESFAVLNYKLGKIVLVQEANEMRPFVEAVNEVNWFRIDKASGDMRIQGSSRSSKYGEDASDLLKEIMEQKMSFSKYSISCRIVEQASTDW